MLGWIKRHWILSIFLLFGGVPASLNYSGYCWEQKRWLSDEEFMLAVAGYTEGSKITKEDAKKFLKDNPECCGFSRGSVGMTDSNFEWLNRITGSIYASGVVEYELTEEERKRNGEGDNYKKKYLTIDTCGKVYDDFSETFKVCKDADNCGRTSGRFLQNRLSEKGDTVNFKQ